MGVKRRTIPWLKLAVHLHSGLLTFVFFRCHSCAGRNPSQMDTEEPKGEVNNHRVYNGWNIPKAHDAVHLSLEDTMSTHTKLVAFSSEVVRDAVMARCKLHDPGHCGYWAESIWEALKTLPNGSWIICWPCCGVKENKTGFFPDRYVSNSESRHGIDNERVFVWTEGGGPYHPPTAFQVTQYTENRTQFVRGTKQLIEVPFFPDD